MAKKAKAKKSKAKKSTTRKPAVERVGLHEVARLFTVIAQTPGATDEFATAAKKREAFIKVDAKTKRFVRRFLTTKNLLKKPASRGLSAAAAPPDRFKCF